LTKPVAVNTGLALRRSLWFPEVFYYLLVFWGYGAWMIGTIISVYQQL